MAQVEICNEALSGQLTGGEYVTDKGLKNDICLDRLY